MRYMTGRTPRTVSFAAARKQARAHLAQFQGDERGSMIVFGLVLLIMMFMVGGLAIDVIRLEITRTQIQNTLDRAVLAATDLQNSEDAKQVVNDYFKKAGLESYMSNDQIDVQTTQSGSQLTYRMVEATSRANVQTMFMHMMGIETLVAAGTSTAQEGISETEVSLVVDVSGSMGWDAYDSDGNYAGSKISALQEAAKDFIYYLQCSPTNARPDNINLYNPADCSVTPEKVSISLIPYSEQVVAGERMFEDMITTADHNYAYCLEFAPEDFNTASIIATDPDNPARQAGYFRDYPTGWNYGENWNCRTDSWRQIRPFMDDYAEAAGHLDSLQSGGSTSIDYGMKWGSAMLLDTFQPVISDLTQVSDNSSPAIVNTAFANRPNSFASGDAVKALILMTDGVNDVQRMLKDDFRSGPSDIWRNTENGNLSIYNAQRDANGEDSYYYPHNNTWNEVPYGEGEETQAIRERQCSYSWWYGYRCRYVTVGYETVEQPGSAVNIPFPLLWKDYDIDDTYNRYSWLEDPLVAYANAEKNIHTNAICTAAKEAGIIVFTIGFEVDNGLDVLRNCATTPGHFFVADTKEDLSDKFFAIASTIDKLRLTQ